MTDERVAAALIGGTALLERAVNYALGSLHPVTPADLARPTPCREWNLRDLLVHTGDSMLALTEAIGTGSVDLAVPIEDVSDPIGRLRDAARDLLGAWSTGSGPPVIAIAGCELTAGIVSGTGAVEVAVHGWDIGRAVGRDRPLPAALAEELLELAPFFVVDADRPARFAAPVTVPGSAGPADRLLAYLGRDPFS
jgi:uncharacterized protein (TIGR03086 family)